MRVLRAAPDWELRFRAPRMSLPQWARDAPDRCLFVASTSGTFELYTWDRATAAVRQATQRAAGTTEGALTPDGSQVWWFDDTAGDEYGVWRCQPFPGGPAELALPGVPAAYPAGLELGPGVGAVGCSDTSGTQVFAGRLADPLRLVYRSEHDAQLAGMSRDGRLLLLEHSEHGDSLHPALRVLDLDGGVVADLGDGPGLGLHAVGFSPVPGDTRVLALHERAGRLLPLVWDPVTGDQLRLDLPIEGDLDADWYADGAALLVRAEHRGRSTLHRVGLDGRTTVLPTPAGTIVEAAARPDETVEFRWSSAAEPSVVRSTRGQLVLSPPGPPAPGSVPVRDAVVPGPGGDVHALVAQPEGAGPWPTVFRLHGGPHHHDADEFSPERAAYVDLGCAVVDVNYRGSTGYGSAWRDAIIGRPGLTELEDVAAVHDWAVGSGLADAGRCAVSGGSWGGYLTLLALGTQPQRWAAGVAAVPVADYLAAYEDEMEQLRAFDRSLFGGSPEQVPERYRRSSPLTYVERLAAPVLVLAGANDPRCPLRQVQNWLAAAERAGVPVEVYRFDAGHGSLVVDERVRQAQVSLDFLGRHLGVEVPGSAGLLGPRGGAG